MFYVPVGYEDELNCGLGKQEANSSRSSIILMQFKDSHWKILNKLNQQGTRNLKDDNILHAIFTVSSSLPSEHHQTAYLGQPNSFRLIKDNNSAIFISISLNHLILSIRFRKRFRKPR
jgi:hypothetical protein